MPAPEVDPEVLAGEIRAVVAALVRQFRVNRALPQPQLAALIWLDRHGPMTTSDLAALERVRPQSMSTTVEQLAASGFVGRRRDATDGRKFLLELTDAGLAALRDYREAGERWISDAITERLSPAEQAELARGIAHLGRLVEG